MRAVFLTTLFGLLFLAGCATSSGRDLIPYNDALRAQHNLTAEESHRLQYYLSDTLEMARQDASAGHRVVDGRLIASAQRNLARVLVDAGTPGIATGVHGNRLAISFAEGSQLNFSPTSSDPSAPYRLETTPTGSGAERVFVYDIPYGITSGNRPYLLIDRETLYRSSEETYRLPGRTLTGP